MSSVNRQRWLWCRAPSMGVWRQVGVSVKARTTSAVPTTSSDFSIGGAPDRTCATSGRSYGSPRCKLSGVGIWYHSSVPSTRAWKVVQTMVLSDYIYIYVFMNPTHLNLSGSQMHLILIIIYVAVKVNYTFKHISRYPNDIHSLA
jgi:hypothetical protein